MKITKALGWICWLGLLAACAQQLGDTVEIGVRNKCEHQLLLMLNYSDGSRTDMPLPRGESLLLRAKRGASLEVIEVRRAGVDLLYKYNVKDRSRNGLIWINLTPQRAELSELNTSRIEKEEEQQKTGAAK